MKSSKILSAIGGVGFCLVLGAAVLVFTQMLGSTKGFSPASASGAQPNFPDQSAQTISSTEATSAASVATAPLDNSVCQDGTAIFQELQERANANYIKPGWVHLRWLTTYDHDLEHNGLLPDGSILVKDYTEEQWLHLDDGLVAIEGVYKKYSATGELLVFTVASNDTVRDMQRGETSPLEGLAKLPFTMPINGFQVIEAERVIDWPEHETKVTTSKTHCEAQQLNGREVYKFVNQESYSQPVKIGQFDLEISQVDTVAYFDVARGSLALIETTMHFPNGSTRLYLHSEMMVEHLDAPPAQILAELAEKEAQK